MPLLFANRLRDLFDDSILPEGINDFIQSAGGPLGTVLDNVYYTDYATSLSPSGLTFMINLAFDGELALEMPGIDGLALVLGSQGSGVTQVRLGLHADAAGFVLRLDDIVLALRFPEDALKPVPEHPGDTPPRYAQLQTVGALVFDSNFDLRVEGFSGLSLAPAMIANSGVVIWARDVKLDLARTSTIPEVTAAGFDDDFVGVYLGETGVRLPEGLPDIVPSDLVLRNAAIGSGGVSGTLDIHYTPRFDAASGEFTGHGAGRLFGVPFAFEAVEIELRRNTFRRCRLAGEMVIPYFQKRIAVDLGFDLEGNFTVRVTGARDPGDVFDPGTGLLTLTLPGVLRLVVDGVGLEKHGDEYKFVLSGSLTPLIGVEQGLEWPSLTVRELSIDSQGHIHVDGGWLELPRSYRLSFYGFQIEIARLGFGRNDDESNWVGFSGGIRLVEGFTAGASVDGLRITWDDGPLPNPRLSLDGVGVELAIEDVLSFRGAVSYRELTVVEDGVSHLVHRFDGNIALSLESIDLHVDARIVVGSDQAPDGRTYTFFAVYVDVDLPFGIPLASTGLGLYGMAGLFALNMEPDRRPDENWYSVDHDHSWFHRDEIGTTDLRHKWINREGSLAFGAGVTIGTVTDNGYIFAGKFLLAIVFPGPIFMLEGMANLLKERAKLATEEPLFRALTVLDCRAGTLIMGLDIHYKYKADGKLLDIHGSCEAFYDFNDGDAWHIYLGQREPRAARIRANLFQIFDVYAYFMVDAHQLATGAWFGYDTTWHYGPLELVLQAWITTEVGINYKPTQYHGDMALHANLGLRVFGFGFTLSVDANIAGDTPHPYHALGHFDVAVALPWPLPTYRANAVLEWGPVPDPPPFSLPLQTVSLEHPKATVTWPLERGRWLLPDYRSAEAIAASELEIAATPPSFDAAAPPPTFAGVPEPARAPVVALDARPMLTFGRSVNDDALVGSPFHATSPEWEQIGDPARGGPVQARYAVEGVALEKWSGGAWTVVAERAKDRPRVGALAGAWAALPPVPHDDAQTVAHTKLTLGTLNSFDFVRHGGRSWLDWIGDHDPAFPCVTPAPEREVCFRFDGLAGEALPPVWTHPAERGLSFRGSALRLAPPPRGTKAERALWFGGGGQTAGDGSVWIDLPGPIRRVRLTVATAKGARLTGRDVHGAERGPVVAGAGVATLQLDGPDLVLLLLEAQAAPASLLEICVVQGETTDQAARRLERAAHLVEEMAHFGQTAALLEPFTSYRLRVVTRVEARGDGLLADLRRNLAQVEYAFFRTEGAPDDLTRYVAQTVPPVLVPEGEGAGEGARVLPRPVYRAYDVGVAFNADYVDLMYRMSRRDLGLYLFDANSRPVRDHHGGLLVLDNRWGRAEQRRLTESEDHWITTINASTCAVESVDAAALPRPAALRAGGHVLAASALHEARLVPLLLHEDFRDGGAASGPDGLLGEWRIVDEATRPASRWLAGSEGTPPAPFVTQVVAATATLLVRRELPDVPADDPAQPGQWTDYRLSAWVRVAADGVVGLAFRRRQASDGAHEYRLLLDRRQRVRRLVRALGPVVTLLAEDGYPAAAQGDSRIVIEAIGAQLRIEQDGRLVFQVDDGALDRGSVGLYCADIAGARFADVRLDDYRAGAPVPFRFSFTTSRFTNFFHHLHSFDDQVAVVTAPGAVLAQAASAAVPADAPPAQVADGEARAFDALAATLPAPSPTTRVRITRLGAGAGFLVESQEPLDWSRTRVALERAGGVAGSIDAPSALKLTSVELAATPEDEWVDLLARDQVDPSGCRIEQRRLPGPIDALDGAPLLGDVIAGPPRGLLYRESFARDSLDRYQIIDEGSELGPSRWLVDRNAIRQQSLCFGGATAPQAPDKPGTLALLGHRDLTDVRVRATLRCDGPGAVGVVLRAGEGGDQIRFALNRSDGWRRLTRRAGGVTTVLWKDAGPVRAAHAYRLELLAGGDRLVGLLDDVLLFQVRVGAVTAGRVGLYAWRDDHARFDALSIDSLEGDPVAWEPLSWPLASWQIVDTLRGPDLASGWTRVDDAIVQTTAVPETFIVGGPEIADGELAARVTPPASGVVGLVARYTDADNYYLFTIDVHGDMRLRRRAGGHSRQLWHGSSTPAGGASSISFRVVGHTLLAFVDGRRVHAAHDAALARGRVGLYTAAAQGASFDRLLCLDRAVRVGPWQIDTPDAAAEDPGWRCDGGMLDRLPARSGVSPATTALIGDLAGDLAGGDVRLSATLTPGGGACSLLFRHIDAGNHYRLTFDEAAGSVSLVRTRAGADAVLWSRATTIRPGEPLQVVIDAAGDLLGAWLAGERLFVVRDAAHTHGRIGVGAAAGTRLALSGLSLTAPLLESWLLAADPAGGDTGDAPWTDVVVSCRLAAGEDAFGVDVRRNAGGDRYRFLMSRLDGERRLERIVAGGATTLWRDRQPPEAGREARVVVVAMGSRLRVYLDDAPVCVVDDTALAAGGAAIFGGAASSEVRVYDGRAARADWSVDERFAYGLSPAWLPFDGGAFLDGQRWTDVRASVRLASSSGAAGLLLEGDGEHTLRFTFDRTAGRLVLEQLGGATPEVLWQGDDAGDPAHGRILTLVSEAGRLSALVDGVARFAGADPRREPGRLGVCFDGPPATQLVELRAADPRWVRVYAFPEQRSLAAGAVVRIPSSLATRPGRRQLDGDRLELRVVSRDGVPEHRRAFAAGAAFVDVASSLLRRRDGTALFVLAGAPLAPGAQRLRFTYLRDPGFGLILSENGDRSPEEVALDLP